jgi:uncharacterized membrane protein YidH (DUF202 family)
LLLSSYIFTLAYNFSASKFGDISAVAKICMFLTILFLFMFLAGFVIFLVSIFHIADVKEIFLNPGKMSIISIIMLLCSYLSTVMHNYVAPALGELSSVAQIFFYLALVFIVFFVITFLAMLVSFSNKFIYKKV